MTSLEHFEEFLKSTKFRYNKIAHYDGVTTYYFTKQEAAESNLAVYYLFSPRGDLVSIITGQYSESDKFKYPQVIGTIDGKENSNT